MKAKAFAYVDLILNTRVLYLRNTDEGMWQALKQDRAEVDSVLDDQHEASLLEDGQIEYSEKGKKRKRYPDKDTFLTAMALQGWEIRSE